MTASETASNTTPTARTAQRVDGIETPALLLDRARMQHNILRMQAQVSALGCRLRPHVKTSKSLPVVQAQMDAGAAAITVSTLKEAEQFFEAGVRDILYAVAMAPNKVAHALALRARGCDLAVIVDSVAAAQVVVDAVRAAGQLLPTLIEIDSDGHRSGVRPGAPALLEIGRLLASAGLMAGVMTHAGSSYDLDTPEALAAMAAQERDAVVTCAQALRNAGVPCPRVSVGSTPTALSATDLSGVTEVRAGVYVFFDLVMAGVGVCDADAIALSVLTSVIGHQPEKGWLIVDAGWMAMSRDRGTQKQKVDHGYGLVCDVSGAPVKQLWMSGANQEHGIVSMRDGSAPADLAQRYPIGTLLRVLPNHACATAAQFDAYRVVEGSDIVERWPRFSGW
jgi:D-serine deaminase-like pyridoxal phosphate-dependent protein